MSIICLLYTSKESGNDSNKEALDRLNRLKSEREHTAEDVEELRERAEQRRTVAAEAGDRERELSKEVEELRISLGQLSARMKTIEEMESNYEGYNYAVKHIMRSGLSGIDGVVAELIKVPQGYETALETALGGALQNKMCIRDRDIAAYKVHGSKGRRSAEPGNVAVSSRLLSRRCGYGPHHVGESGLRRSEIHIFSPR